MMFKGLSVGWLKGVNQHRQVEWGRRGRLSYLTIALLFSVALTLSASQAQISTTRWTNPAGGDWHNPSNWDNGVPDANKQAVIDLPGTYTVRINSSATAAGLVLGNDDPSDTGTKTLTVSSTLTLNGDGVIKPRSVMVLTGTLTGSGKMQVEGLMEWRIYGKMEGQGETVVVSGGQMKVGSSGYYVTLRRKLTNEGSVVLEAGTLYLGQNGLLQNKGTFEVKDNTYISLTDNQPGLFVNEGTLRKGEGDGTAYVYAKVENKGTIEVLAGKISFGSSGHLVMMDGSQIKTNESGYLLIDSGGVIEAVEGATGKVAQGSRMVLIGLLTGSGKMQVEGLMEWRIYGKMEGQGETVVVSGGQMKVGSSGYYVTLRRKLTNEGSVVLEAGTLYLGQNGLLQNKGTFEVKDNTYISLTDNQPGLFVNEGTLRKGEGDGTAYVYAKVENKGTIEVLAGRISFGSSGHLVMMDGSQIKTNESGYLLIDSGGVIEAVEGATGKVAQGSRMVLIGLLTGSGKMQVEGLMEWRIVWEDGRSRRDCSGFGRADEGRKQWLLCDFEAEVDQRRECGFGGRDFVFGTERFASKQGNF
jgi:hypothetical protein